MANTKITSLTELAATPATNDVYPIVDISDTTMAATGTTKKIQAARILHTNGTANTLGANLNLNGFAISGGAVSFGTISDFYASNSGSNAFLNFDANDYLLYDRAANSLDLVIGLSLACRVNYQGNLTVPGTVTCVDLVETSSRTEKENFSSIDGVLNKLASINAYKYNDKKDKDTKKIGFIAEDFIAEFPEVVSEVDILEGMETRKVNGLNYSRIIPIVLQGLKELNKKYEDGLQEIKDLKEEIKDFKAKSKL